MDDSIGEYSSSSRASYVSCMKINGVPLIPPLMTPEYRQEMQYYKQLAMAVERRLYDLKICLDETTMNSNMLRSDSEEWCDGVNLSIMSSKSENQTISNQFKKSFRNADVKFKNEVFENNDFESMNSQVTVIDNDPENSTASNVGKDDYSESFASSSIDVFTTETNTSFTKKSDDSDTCNQSNERKFKSSNVISPTSHTRSTKNNDKDTDFAKQNRSLPNGIQHFNNKDNLNVEGKAKILNSKEVFKIDKSHSKSSITKISTSASKTKKEISNRKDKINQPKNVSLSSSKKSEIILKNTSNLLKLRKKPLPLDKNRTKLSPSKNVTGSLNNISSGLASPPKLFRQNSYTLEYPSPLLLAHLEEKSLASGIDLRSISMSESTSTSFLCNSSKQKSWDSNTAKETWSSIGSDINSISMNETSEINHSAKEKLGIKENKGPISNIVDRNTNELLSNESHFKCLDRSVDPSETFEKSSSNVIEYYEKDKDDNVADDLLYVNPIYETPIKSKLVNQNILLSSNSCDRSTRDNMQLLPSVVNLSSKPNVDSNIYFNKLLKKFQDEHDKKLNELIRKQNEEQIFLKKTFENQQKLLLTQFQIAFNQNKHMSEDNFEKNSDHSNFGGLKNGHSDISTKEKHEINSQERLDNKTEKKVQASEILNTEKYLTMSSDAISKSKHKISNQQASLNASYTIDLVPTQENKSIHVKSSCEKNPIQLHDDARLKKPMDKSQTELKPMDKTNNICLYPEVQTIDFNKFSSKEYYCDDSQLDDSIATERTSNTLDDVNFTFASDDASSANECKSHYETFISNPMHREADGMSKLKSAFDKITKIQQNLASQPNYRERSYSIDKNYYKDNTYASSSNQIISLSSISSKSSAYFDSSSSQNSIVDKNSLSLNLIEVNRPRNDGIVQKCYRKILQYNEKEIQAATIIVAYTKGYLTRRLMRTERVESTVQTIRDTLLCALQLHRDEGGIQGADVDLHRRLIQQITAACYALHDMFIIFTPAERMSIISQDRDRKISLSHRSSSSTSSTRQLSATTQKILKRKLEGMSKSHTGVFTTKPLRTSHLASQPMTRSHYEHNDQLQSGISDKSRRSVTVTGEHVSRKPWR